MSSSFLSMESTVVSWCDRVKPFLNNYDNSSEMGKQFSSQL